MAQWVTVFATKSDNLTPMSGIHIVERRNNCNKLSSDSVVHMCRWVCTCTHTHKCVFMEGKRGRGRRRGTGDIVVHTFITEAEADKSLSLGPAWSI